MRIFGVALLDGAADFHHIFAAEGIGRGLEFGVDLGVEHHLGDAVAVADVDESHAAHFSDALHPTGDTGLAPRISQTQFAAGIVSIHAFIRDLFLC